VDETNRQFNGGGKLKPEYRQVWANYFVRFIHEYEKEGVPIWGVTVQNEPAAAQVWDSCLYSAEEERDFVRDHLGPTFKKAGLERVKIIIWDHNRDLLIERVQVAYNDPEASPYIWGAAFHWYGPENTRTFNWPTTLGRIRNSSLPKVARKVARISVPGTWGSVMVTRSSTT